jgi:hypothetical protein
MAGIGFTRAKTVLSPNEERQAILELALVRREKADQPTEMIVMAVAQTKASKLAGSMFSTDVLLSNVAD